VERTGSDQPGGPAGPPWLQYAVGGADRATRRSGLPGAPDCTNGPSPPGR